MRIMTSHLLTLRALSVDAIKSMLTGAATQPSRSQATYNEPDEPSNPPQDISQPPDTNPLHK